MVAGPHPFTADAGLEALRAGGNAVDAAVAAALTEGVVQPAHNGLAGYGGAAVLHLAASNTVACLDFNTEAPAAATETMFQIDTAAANPPFGYAIAGSLHKRGALSVGIPGVLAGLAELHEKWGSLPIAQLLQPAINAAQDGWPCNTATSRNTREIVDDLRRCAPRVAAMVLVDGEVPEPGQILTNPDLALTLEELSELGLRAFYEGDLGRRIATMLQTQGGIMTAADLKGYRARHVETVSAEFGGVTLHTPPIGCGGVTSLQVLLVLDELARRGTDFRSQEPASPGFFHLYTEVLKVCWRRRLATLGEPAFTGHPESLELEPSLVVTLADAAAAGLANPSPGERVAADPFYCTSHICAADAAGNVVSLTQTHGAAYGSWTTVPGTGLIFGHGMARFEPRPGHPNSVAPGKRPLHNMAPILAMRGNRPLAAYGTPGGRTIVNNQAYFSLAMWGWGLEPAAALALPRIHVEECEPVQIEDRAGSEDEQALSLLGHSVQVVERSGGPAHVITLGDDPSEMDGATDPRFEGKVAWE